ncbi:right-handed parallel beta-helix repeat-containing protein [Flammeovirga aprica]|uniref:Right-handed parallel beta-helix repeat-containing protein n=1 Tax=Flammeovirga aprica JL-4 TaxID=694437 RepID=A0A7X9RWX8_9BACT|nr:right-handed parallel beta-helix repeat-containing protein [Flammeovirga aprica]NME70205.1 right-handed parallel beta-helix repeat-containing protein [Flammeovirga aprica JL-4]
MKKLIVILALLVSVYGFSVNSGQTIKVGNTKDITEDATPYVLKQLKENKGAKTIEFEKGTYHFYPDKGLNKFVYLSNHKDVFVSLAFPVENYKDFTIDGQGSTFIFHGKMIPFLVDDSENITIKNVKIDWAMSFHSEGEIIAHHKEEHAFDVRFGEEYPYDIRNEQIYFIKEYYEHDLGQTILYDKERRAISYNNKKTSPISTYQKSTTQYGTDQIKYKYKVDKADLTLRKVGTESRLKVNEVEPGVVRFFNHKKGLPPIGNILSTKGQQGENRVAPGIRVSNSKSFFLENVTIHHAGGMGLLVENSEDIFIDKLTISPSGDRMVSTTADATHFVGCRGQIKMTNSLLENQLDDCINIHGAYQEVVEQLADNKLGIRMGHHQQEGFVIGRKGDTIGFVKIDESFTPFHQLTIASIEVINQRYQVITFEEKIPAAVVQGDYIENLSAYPEVILTNNKFQGNRARGVLLSTPKKALVKDNYFHSEMDAIFLPVESSKWYESGAQSNLIIEGNTFDNCNFGGTSRGIIRLVTDEDNESIAFHNITIRNNTFKLFDNLVLEVSNTDGLVFENNKILSTNTFPQLYPENPAYIIKSSKNVVFKNNDFQGKATKMMECDESAVNVDFQ